MPRWDHDDLHGRPEAKPGFRADPQVHGSNDVEKRMRQWIHAHQHRVVALAVLSPCAKSKRGVVVVDPITGDISGSGFNSQPEPFRCDGSDACRDACGKLCVHAEAAALRRAGRASRGAHLIHLKVVDGAAVPSGVPSCWQCSREVLAAGISVVWLLQSEGWQPHTAEEFHAQTLAHCGLPVIRGSR